MSEPTIVEQIEQFKRGEKRLSDLPQSTQDAILSGQVPAAPEPPKAPAAEPQPGGPEPQQPAAAPDKPEPPKVPAPQQDKKGEPPRKPKSRAELQRLAKERADKLNTLEQRERAHELRLQRDPAYRAEYFRKLGIEPPQQQAVDNEKEELRKELEAIKAEKQLARLYDDMDGFLREQGASVSVSVRDLDGAARKVERVEGRTATAADLVALGFDSEDAEAYETLVAVQKHQLELGYPTFTSAWADYQRQGGKRLPARQQQIAATEPTAQEPVDDREARREQMRRALSSPKSLPSQRSLPEAASGLTKAQALEWLKKHPNPLYYSEEQRRVWAKIKPMITGK